jgi:hypothetical protein
MKLMDRIAYKAAEKNFMAIFKLASYDDTKIGADSMNDALDNGDPKWGDIVEAFYNMDKARNEGRCFPFYDSEDLAIVQIWNLIRSTIDINAICLLAKMERARGSRA